MRFEQISTRQTFPFLQTFSFHPSSQLSVNFLVFLFILESFRWRLANGGIPLANLSRQLSSLARLYRTRGGPCKSSDLSPPDIGIRHELLPCPYLLLKWKGQRGRKGVVCEIVGERSDCLRRVRIILSGGGWLWESNYRGLCQSGCWMDGRTDWSRSVRRRTLAPFNPS